jgi:hypothetical protein
VGLQREEKGHCPYQRNSKKLSSPFHQ